MTTTLRFCNRPRSWGLLCGLLLLISLLVSLLPADVAQAAATTITFDDFADISALTLNGNAAQVGTVLRLAPAVHDQKGSAYLTAPQRINSFQSRFQFHFNGAVNNTNDGMTFVIQNAGVNALGFGGGNMGYQGMRPSVAVFFDPESGCGQKVGIAINGGSVDGCAAGVAPPFNLYGSPVAVWVDYDASSTTLQVFLAQDTNKPAAPLLSQNVNIRSTVGPAAFVGFTAATGGAFMNHDLLNWSFILETLPPVAVPTQTPPANDNGWNNSNVTVNWNWEDAAGPGIDAANCTMSSSASAEGQSTLSATCKDLAGNQGSASAQVNIDKTRPTISAAATTNPNDAGWYNSDVTVHFTCADGTSGVANCPADEVLSSEGSAVASTAQTVSDLAGNTSDPSNVVKVQLDKTAPVVAVTGVSNGASYPLGSVPAAGCTTSDALSGVATDATLAVTGGNPDGTGSYTATCSGASDKAGNTATAAANYTVINNPPTAAADSYSTDEDTPLTVAVPGVLGNDSDPDPGDSLTAVLSGSPAHGTLTLNANGSFSYTPEANYNGSDSFSYKARDSHNAESSQVTVSITVNAVNDPPTIAVAAGGACSSTGTGGTMNLTVGDMDSPVGGVTLTGASSEPKLVPYSNILFGGSGANRTVTTTAVPQKGIKSAVITVSADDASGGTSTVTFSVFVGTDKNETLNGTGNTDLIFGLLGANTINGLGGNDLLCGGNGVDTINGGDGDDTLGGNRGNDVLNGEGGNDRLTGGQGGDRFNGGAGNDTTTDFTPSGGDTQDGTVEGVTVLAAGVEEAAITNQIFLPAVQR